MRLTRPFSVILLLTIVAASSVFIVATYGESCFAGGVREDCCTDGDCGEAQCQAKGCCWSPVWPPNNCDNGGLPYCFHPNPPLTGYKVFAVKETVNGWEFDLSLANGNAIFGEDITPLRVSVYMDTSTRLHVKIFDPNNQRWEVPNVALTGVPSSKPAISDYQFSYTESPFGFAVVRANTGEVLFNSTTTGTFNGLVFENQYLEISTQLQPNANIYGLGEHVHSLRLNSSGTYYTLWANDQAGTPPFINLYGSHPFYMELLSSGRAHGVFLLNSNGMDIYVGPEQLTYRVTGGILDFYFFTGPTPGEVIQQYLDVIGKPYLPAYWTLGWHQCRWGYEDIQAVEEVVAQYTKNDIPLDTMWTDIDYMDGYRDYTFDPNKFPVNEVQRFVKALHANGQRYVVIDDCGIQNMTGYQPWEKGLQMGIFIKDKTGTEPFIGQVWPGNTAWTDFLNPRADQYWYELIRDFYGQVPIDGLWTDMNEPSNFCNGPCTSGSEEATKLNKRADPNVPPYSINNRGCRLPLYEKTLSMDSRHYSTIHFNAHNLYGMTEANSTSYALERVTGKRSFVLSRSTFPGHGRTAAHWLGDNYSSWDDLYYAIPGILNFNMFGIPLVGADICGFGGSATEELCARWMQVGAFYPFARNHNTKGAPSQEPYVWPTVANISRSILRTRYSLLPYYYTLFYHAHIYGTTVARPLFFEYPSDPTCWDLDKQFLIGGHLLISPVLEPSATIVHAYFPMGVWYDFWTRAPVTTGKAVWLDLDTPLDKIQVHVLGGGIIPTQEPALTTTRSRNNPFGLIVALSQQGHAYGDLYLDDGESLAAVENSIYTLVQYEAHDDGTTIGLLTGELVSKQGFGGAKGLFMGQIEVLGVVKPPQRALLDGVRVAFTYDASVRVLSFSGLNITLSSNFALYWHYR